MFLKLTETIGIIERVAVQRTGKKKWPFLTNLATSHLSGKLFSKDSSSSQTGYNDTDFKSLSCRGAENIKGQTNKPTNFGYYIIDLCNHCILVLI
jgi:hypothetical protein